MKLAIGTAQFGLDYGISNQQGKTLPQEVRKILSLAYQNGIQYLDTAPVYGDSEEILGKTLTSLDRLKKAFKIVTKTPHFSKSCITHDDTQILENTFHKSLLKLKQDSVYGLLIHNVNDLLIDSGHLLIDKMIELKEKGLVKKIGVSVYTGEEIDWVLEKYSIDLIQLPINLLDQRLIISGHLRKIKDKGIEIHARSIFLQGLILMNITQLPPHFRTIREHLQKLHDFLSYNKISPIEAAITFLKHLHEIDISLVGINNDEHLEKIISATHQITELSMEDFYQFGITDSLVLNPALWKI